MFEIFFFLSVQFTTPMSIFYLCFYNMVLPVLASCAFPWCTLFCPYQITRPACLCPRVKCTEAAAFGSISAYSVKVDRSWTAWKEWMYGVRMQACFIWKWPSSLPSSKGWTLYIQVCLFLLFCPFIAIKEWQWYLQCCSPCEMSTKAIQLLHWFAPDKKCQESIPCHQRFPL